MTSVTPPAGVVDARFPWNTVVAGESLGINRFIISGPIGADDSCWSLCVNGSPGYQNSIIDIRFASNRYIITTQVPLPPASCAVLSYTDLNGATQNLTYYIHPGNANADGFANANDIGALLGYLNGTTPPFGHFSSDANRSGMFTPADIITLIDILNGAGPLSSWNNTARPNCSACLNQ